MIHVYKHRRWYLVKSEKKKKVFKVLPFNAEVWIGTSQVSKENVAIISESQITSLEIKY